MDLDSIYRFIEETHIFGTQPSAGKAPGDGDAGAPGAAPRDPRRSRRPPGGLQPHAAPSARARAAEWDICAELRLRELEAAQARAAQLEQTMRWWSDCTATWREKWSKARAESTRAREEGRQLRLQLERAAKELSALKQQRSRAPGTEALEAGEAQARARPGFPAASCGAGDPAQIGSQTCESIRECLVKRESPTKENTPSVEEGLILHPLGLNEEVKRCSDRLDVFEKGSSENCAVKPGLRQHPGHPPLQNEAPKISALQVHLDEFQKILRQERDMRSSLEREIERLQSAVSSWKQKYEELNASTSRTRRELERLQVENASERDQREILETEKQELERENRSLKAQVKEMDELLKAKNRLNASSQGPDFKTSHIELQENHKGRAAARGTETRKKAEVLGLRSARWLTGAGPVTGFWDRQDTTPAAETARAQEDVLRTWWGTEESPGIS
uniref:Coiled-coil domain containing 102B n=1 Tax=Molossus molossus TaxID=27622 RepID=A0A7J8HFS5_MOLMO|nr:coiled-coil domain containing 102B [Molossus molossus]